MKVNNTTWSIASKAFPMPFSSAKTFFNSCSTIVITSKALTMTRNSHSKSTPFLSIGNTYFQIYHIICFLIDYILILYLYIISILYCRSCNREANQAVEEFKYLGTTINSRNVITPALKALKKRTNLCMHAIHKLSSNIVDMTTRLDIFSVYIQPHLIGCLASLAFVPKTTVTTFCTHFMATLKRLQSS